MSYLLEGIAWTEQDKFGNFGGMWFGRNAIVFADKNDAVLEVIGYVESNQPQPVALTLSRRNGRVLWCREVRRTEMTKFPELIWSKP